jgi:hypothetical protein
MLDCQLSKITPVYIIRAWTVFYIEVHARLSIISILVAHHMLCRKLIISSPRQVVPQNDHYLVLN